MLLYEVIKLQLAALHWARAEALGGAEKRRCGRHQRGGRVKRYRKMVDFIGIYNELQSLIVIL